MADLLDILEVITNWAHAREDIRGLALIGSHARNAARPDSDIDLVLLTKNPGEFRDVASLAAINWSRAGVHPTRWSDEEYGVVWSRRIWLQPQREIEFGFAPLSWADVLPIDRGTYQVVRDGSQVLYDPDGLLKRLQAAVLAAQNRD